MTAIPTIGSVCLASLLLSAGALARDADVRFLAENGSTWGPNLIVDLGDGVSGYCFGAVVVIERSGAYWYTGLAPSRIGDGRGRLVIDGRRSIQPLDWDQTRGAERTGFVEWNIAMTDRCR